MKGIQSFADFKTVALIWDSFRITDSLPLGKSWEVSLEVTMQWSRSRTLTSQRRTKCDAEQDHISNMSVFLGKQHHATPYLCIFFRDSGSWTADSLLFMKLVSHSCWSRWMACILWQVMMRDAMMGKAVLRTDDESCWTRFGWAIWYYKGGSYFILRQKLTQAKASLAVGEDDIGPGYDGAWLGSSWRRLPEDCRDPHAEVMHRCIACAAGCDKTLRNCPSLRSAPCDIFIHIYIYVYIHTIMYIYIYYRVCP